MKLGSVVWISGYSSSGKTTVSRLVAHKLRKLNYNVILLDGDELRSIFSFKWGYTRADRVELAKVYFRLCRHLSSQGFTVVIAAVALYEEVYDWIQENISNVYIYYLEVPESVRRHRDSIGKNIYSHGTDLENIYDGPGPMAITISNSSGVNPNDVALTIVDKITTNQSVVHAKYGRNKHWQEYYQSKTAPTDASSFAYYVSNESDNKSKLLDVGCGNGRDSKYFAKIGMKVIAIDMSEAAINFARESCRGLDIKFHCGSILTLTPVQPSFDVIYSRFVLHAMPVEEEISLLNTAYRLLVDGGAIYIECRSINDPLSRKGEVISSTERIFGHYRRFIVKEELLDRLETIGYRIVFETEATGVSDFGDDKPVVIRVKAIK
jgi:adenylylsulfate kinase-like enzyme/2-polyprenyl-3-methyl-5-hydroxy-6-metoxy-1,4-benzoquinol methylase